MKSKGIAVLVIFLFLLILSGCAPEESAAPVLIVGDVDQVFEFSNTAALESVSANGKSYKALPLEKVLEEAAARLEPGDFRRGGQAHGNHRGGRLGGQFPSGAARTDGSLYRALSHYTIKNIKGLSSRTGRQAVHN